MLRGAPFNLDWGSSISAKVTAINIVGEGPTSLVGNNAVITTNPDEPTLLINVAGTTSSSTIKMSWTAPANVGGTPIIDYRIAHKLAADGDETYTNLADSIAEIFYTTTSLVSGSEYTFKVEARNAFGYSLLYSNTVTILQAQIPDTPVSLANADGITAAGVVGLTWTDGSFNGASTVVDYTLLYDQGLGGSTNWIELVNSVATNSYTASGLQADIVYQFKVKSRNAVGFSLESSILSIRASKVPAQADAPTTEILSSDVKIVWVNPDNGGSAISAVRIVIRQSDGITFTEDSTNCDGSDSTIVAAK